MSDSEINRGKQAERELKEVEAAFDAVRAECVRAVFESPSCASVEREQLYLAVRTIDKVRTAIRQVIDSGTIAQAAKDAAKALATSEKA